MILDLWNDLVSWVRSDAGWTIITGAILPFIAILAGGIIAALIAKSGIKRFVKRQSDDSKAAAIAGLLAVARRATVWTSLSAAEKDHVDYQITESVVRLRLQPVTGADLAAEWSQLRIAAIKRQSATLIAQAESELRDLENGLIEWHRKPSRAKKLFGSELGWLRLDDAELDKDLLARQKQWMAEQQRAAGEPAAAAPSPQAAAPAAGAAGNGTAATAPISTDDLSGILAGGSSTTPR